MTDWIPVVVALVTAAGAILGSVYVQRRKRLDVRATITSDLEILKALDPAREEHERLQAHVAWRIDKLIDFERRARCDRTSMASALILWAGAIMAILMGLDSHGLWRAYDFAAVPLLILGGCWFIPAFKKNVRDM